jgi:glutamine synthetase
MPEKPEPEEKKHITTLQLPESWYEALRRQAFEERKSLAELIREALRDQYGLKCV